MIAFFNGQSQQDGQYSQYMFNHLAINPAYAGTREWFDATMLARRQWTFDGAPRTFALTLQGPLGKKKAGLGFQMGSESIGPKKIGSASLSYSYRIKLGPGKLAFGLRSTISNYVYDWKAITYKDKSDPFASLDMQGYIVPSVDFGMYYYTKSFYAGACVTHLNQASLYKLSDTLNEPTLWPHFFAPVGFGIPVNDNFTINPSVLVKYVSGAPIDFDFNCNFLIDKKLWLGAGYRLGYGVNLLASWNVNERLRMGYSYDYGLNKIGTLGKGSHEIMIGYGFNVFHAKTLTPRYL